MKWKDLLSNSNTRVTVVGENSFLEKELQKAMDTIEIIEEMQDEEPLAVAVKVEVLNKKEGKCWETLFPMIWFGPMDELDKHFKGIKLSSRENVAVRATIIFPDQTEYILLVCKSELE